MKHKAFLAALFGVMAAAAGIMGLASCGSASGNTAHKHSAKAVSAVAATCTADGNTDYYYCSGCGKYFSDSACSKEITEAATVVASTGHTYVTTTVESTCTEDGYIESVCSACGDKQTKTLEAAGHSLTYTAAKTATCTEEGSTGYYYCSNCGKYFADESGTSEIDKSDAVIAKSGHSLTYTAEKAATCMAEGNMAYYYCSTCGRYFADEAGATELSADALTTAKTAHRLAKSEYRVATCTAEGHYAYWYCVACGNRFADEGQTLVSKSWGVIAKTAHNYVNGVCSVCGDSDSSNSGAETGSSQGLEYKLSDDGTYYSVLGIGTCEDTDIVISSTYNGLPVKAINSRAFYSCASLTNITIPDSITSIGRYAFLNCTSLTNINIPDSVTSIGDQAFYGCSSVIETEDGVQYVDKWAISYNYGITSIALRSDTKGIIDLAFFKTSGSSFTSATIPDSVKYIGLSAFVECYKLTSVTIGSGVESIGDNAFYGCSALAGITVDGNNQYYKSVDGNLYSKDGTVLIQYAVGKNDTTFAIPDGVTTIGDGALAYGSALTSVTIPDGVTSIGSFAFNYGSALTSVTFGNTSGWSLDDGTQISSTDLADPATAAEYLTDAYYRYVWSRS